MQWFLDIPIPAMHRSIHYKDNILALGSCFAEHIPQKMQDLGWNCLINPLGLQYNPCSLIQSTEWLLHTSREEIERELFLHNGLWRHWMTHTERAHPNKSVVIETILTQQQQLQEMWQKPSTLCLTFGSSHAWKLKNTAQYVSNCHQLPHDLFQRELLSIETMAHTLKKFIQSNSWHTIICTVSPVRYHRDGVIASNHSKARLLEVIHQICAEFPQCYYFPSYEIQIDSLRDYRFYTSDLCHPSTDAITYIWEKWQTLFDTDTKEYFTQASKILSMRNHRILHPESNEAQAFVQKRKTLESDFFAHYQRTL